MEETTTGVQPADEPVRTSSSDIKPTRESPSVLDIKEPTMTGLESKIPSAMDINHQMSADKLRRSSSMGSKSSMQQSKGEVERLKLPTIVDLKQSGSKIRPPSQRPSVTVAPKDYKLPSRSAVPTINPRQSSIMSTTSIMKRGTQLTGQPPIFSMTGPRITIYGTPDAEAAQLEMVRTGQLCIIRATVEPQRPRDSLLLMTMKPRSVERRSKIGSLGGSLMSFRHTAGSDSKIPMMNTYHLKSKNPFKPDQVNQVIRAVLDKEMEGVKYEPTTCMRLCMTLSADLRAKVKALGYDRYKLVCCVNIGEKNCQSMTTGLRFLWDTDRDNYAFYTYENASLYALATVYGVYYE
ncbi:uncharacterized protein [Periplaneta americana]|uniref:uncharacterized protein n=1 Tax=Periplaneta americana TaxID=6978 RepID=UPI0037E70D56